MVGVSLLQASIGLAMGSLALYLVAILILLYAVWGLALLFLQPKMLYRPTREVSLTPAHAGLSYEEVEFRSADGVQLVGWLVPARAAPFTLLLCHGNGGNLMHTLDTLKLFHRLGLSCFAFDYRGYGRSAGRPTEAGTYLDARAAYDWLTSEKEVPANQILLLGRSLGGSIATHLAGRVPVAGLVIESAFTSFVDIARQFYPYLPVRWFVRFRYDTLADVKQVRCPVMVVHSRDDELVPFTHGHRLLAAAQEPKRFVEIGGSHNEGFLLSSDVYEKAWLQWLQSVQDSSPEDVTCGAPQD